MTVRTDGQALATDQVSDRPTLAVPYDISSSSPLELVDALDGACRLVWVVDGADPRLGAWARLLPRLGQVVDIAGRDVDEVAADLTRLGVDGVVAFADSQLLLAARLCEALGLDGNPTSAVEALTDKVVQRAVLDAAGIPGPAFVAVDAGTTVDEAIALVDRLHHPVVIKPRRGSGSQDTVRSPDTATSSDHLRTVLAEPGAPDLIVEEWLGAADDGSDGPFADYVSVEAVARHGTIVPLALTGKFALAAPCRETGNFLPHLLDPAVAEQVLEVAVRAGGALGVRSGALHIEVKLTSEGPALIEVNGRIGGGAIDALHASVHGRTLTGVAASVAVGDPVELHRVDVHRSDGPFAYAYFVQAPMSARVLTGLGNLEAVGALDGVVATTVNRTVGDRLDWRDGSMGYLVSVRGVAPSADALAGIPRLVDDVLDASYD